MGSFCTRISKKAGDDDWDGTFLDYLDGLQISGCWATYLECFALAASLHRAFLILTRQGEVWSFDRENGNAAICLYFDPDVGHYEFLLGPVEEELRQWAKQHSGRTGKVACGGGRGGISKRSVLASDACEEEFVNQVKLQAQKGGKDHLRATADCDVHCGLSDFASDHDSLPFPEANGLGSSHGLTEFATPPRHFRKKTRILGNRSGRKAGYLIHAQSAPLFSSPAAGSDFELLDACQDARNPTSKVVHTYFKRGSRFSAGQQRKLRWGCPHCPFVCEADTSRKICLSHHHHIELAHNGQYQVGTLRRQVAIGPVTGTNVAWKCPF